MSTTMDSETLVREVLGFLRDEFGAKPMTSIKGPSKPMSFVRVEVDGRVFVISVDDITDKKTKTNYHRG